MQLDRKEEEDSLFGILYFKKWFPRLNKLSLTMTTKTAIARTFKKNRGNPVIKRTKIKKSNA